jgi:hypothetical protein
LFSVVERGIEAVDSLFIERFAVHAAEEVGIDFCGIEGIA